MSEVEAAQTPLPVINISEQIQSCLESPDDNALLISSKQKSVNFAIDRSSNQSKTAHFKQPEDILFLDEIIASAVSTHLEEMFATLQSEQDGEKDQEFDLGLNSVLSQKDVVNPDVSKVSTPQKQQPSAASDKTSNVPLTINLSNGSFQTSLMRPSPPNSSLNVIQFTLKNDSTESTLNTFELLSLQNQFQIMSNSNNAIMIRKKDRPSTLQSLFCCLTNKAVQVYQFKQSDNMLNLFTLAMVEGNKEEYMGFSEVLRQRLWEINQIIEDESLMLFLQINKSTTIKELRQELSEHQNKRSSEEYVMEFSLDRVMETIDMLADSFSKKSASATTSPAQVTVISKFVFRQSGILDIYKKIFKNQQTTLQKKKKKIKSTKAFTDLSQPYKAAIQQLQYSNTLILPSQLMQCLTSYNQKVKDGYRTIHQKIDIQPSDLLQVHVFLLIHSELDHFYSKMKLIEWFIKRSDRFQAEMDILRSLFAAVEEIGRQGK